VFLKPFKIMVEINQSSNVKSVLEDILDQEHSKQLIECNQKGEEDGIRNLPPIDNDAITPFERGLLAKSQAQIEQIFEEGGQMLNEIRDKHYKPTTEKLTAIDEQELENQLTEAEQDRDRKLEETDHNHKDKLKDLHNNPKWISAQRDFKNMDERFKRVSSRLGREELHIQFQPFWLYVLLISAIGFAEIPLNYQVFVSFRETPLLTLIMALVLVISLPFLSHSSGKFLKQGKERKTYYYLLGISVVLITIVSYCTAILRMQYLSTKGVDAEHLITDKWTFFVIGLVLFFVGLVASYFAHDESVEFTEVYKRYHDLKKYYDDIQSSIYAQISSEKDRFMASKESIQEQFTNSKTEIFHRKTELKNALHNSVGNFNKILSYYRGLEKKVNQNCQQAIHHYRDTNLTYRTNHAQPQSWKSDLPTVIYRLENVTELSITPQYENEEV
jgi:flagellar basal body-associated protein FliL